MKVTDEMLMAYADNELEQSLRIEVERELALDSGLVEKLQQHRMLRRQLASEFDPVLAEPVPDRLKVLLKNAPTTATPIDLSSVRESRSKAESISKAQGWLPMAASLVVGVLIGFLIFKGSDRQQELVSSDGRIAHRELTRALAQDLASQSSNSIAQVGITYRSMTGELCRSFVLKEVERMAGIACHEKNSPATAWRLHRLMPMTMTAESENRTAATALPAELLATMNREITGEALDSESEEKARAANWN